MQLSHFYFVHKLTHNVTSRRVLHLHFVHVAFTSTMSLIRNVVSGVLTRLFRRKSMARESLQLNTSQLARVLTVWDLTALGVGSTLGIHK